MRIRVRVLFAVAMSVVAAGLVSWTIHRAERRLAGAAEPITILRARRYVAKGTIVSASDVRTVRLPAAAREPHALTDVNQLTGSDGKPYLRARIEILEGEQVTRSDLLAKDDGLGLAWSLEPGWSAVTVRLKPEEAAGGWVRPGDRVDVYAAIPPQPGWPDTRSVRVLGGVRVFAAGGRRWDPNDVLAAETGTKEIEPGDIFLTLGVTPHDAARLDLAARTGALRVALISALSSVEQRAVSARLADLR